VLKRELSPNYSYTYLTLFSLIYYNVKNVISKGSCGPVK